MSIPALAQQQGCHLQTRPVNDGPRVMLTILMFTLPIARLQQRSQQLLQAKPKVLIYIST
jgi:hypothetical protein